MIRIQDIPMKKKLIGLFLIMGLFPLIVLGIWSAQKSKTALMKNTYSQLVAIREIKKNQIAAFFEERHGDMDVVVSMVDQMRSAAFQKLDTVQQLKKTAIESYFDTLGRQMRNMKNDPYVKEALTALEHVFRSEGNRVKTPAWEKTASGYDARMQAICADNGWHDLFLISSSGDIVYTCKRESDLGMRIPDSEIRDSSLGSAFRTAGSMNSDGIVIGDFSPYAPSKGRSSAFMMTRLNDESGRRIGFAAFQIPIDRINAIAGQRDGMGKTGESYLVGKTGERISFRSEIKTMGDGKYVIGYDITDISTAYIDAALSGKNGADVFTDTTGKLVLVAYDPLAIPGLNWACISKIDMEEAIAGLTAGETEDFFTKYIQSYGYYDLFLIHPEGEIFYSVQRESDYGTNIVSGPYRDSGLGDLVRRVIRTREYGMADFSPYEPSNGEPVGFIAEPLLHDGEPELIVAAQISIDAVNAVMQQRDGMGETGETYLVGPDKRMRSDSYLDPRRRSVSASFAGSIGENGVDTAASTRALSGKSDIALIKDYNGNNVLSAFAPISLAGFNWALIAEIDHAEVMTPVNQLMMTIAAASALLLSIIAVIAFFIGKQIADPLIRGATFAETVSNLDLTARIDVDQKDEVGLLASTLRTMADTLSEIIRKISDTATEVSGASEELSAVSSQMASAAEEMNAQSGTVASATEQISASVGTVASAAEESSQSVTGIAAMTEEMSANISNVADAVRKTADEAQNAAGDSESVIQGITYIASAVEELTTSMNEIAKSTTQASVISRDAGTRTVEINTKMEALVKASKQIGKVIGIIKDIADQTNMLALNATIEAAGAGEAGKGFAVVAGEVKELARQSAEATDTIAEEIDRIRQSTDDMDGAVTQIGAVIENITGINETIASSVEEQSATAAEISRNVAQNADSVKRIATAASDTATRMNDMEKYTDEVSKGANEVSAHIEELNRGVKDVARSAAEAAAGVQDISKNVQGISLAARETATGATQTSQSSKEMARMATTLSDIVGRFRI